MDIDSLTKPILDKFKQDLAKIENQTVDVKKDNERELNNTAKYNESLKTQRDKNNKDTRLKLEELQHDIDENKFLKGQLEKELSYTTQLNNEIRKDSQNAKQTLKNAEAERNLALEERKKQEKITKKVEDNIKALKTDFEILEKSRKELNESINKNKSKERELLKREEKLIEESRLVSIREIDVIQQEKNIKLEMKRLNV